MFKPLKAPSFIITDKQNLCTLKASTQSMNFGKSIKFKAQMLSKDTTPLVEKKINNNRYNQFDVEEVESFSKVPFRRSVSLNSEEDFGKGNKSVRFEDEESEGEKSMISLKSPAHRRKPSSILKKSQGFDKISINSGNSDLGLVDCLPAKQSLRDKGGCSSNDLYHKSVKALKSQNVKFVDKLFPPGQASLSYSKQRRKEMSEVRWARIEDVFKNKKLVMFNANSNKKCIITEGFYPHCRHMAVAFNALTNSNRCLQRIVEEQKYLGLCIYSMRLNRDGIWQYNIVDDHIPVVKRGEELIPAFLNVIENQDREIEMWPFLVHKCLAKIYNCYECLFDDTVDNLLYELTGYHSQVILLDQESSVYRLRSMMLHTQTVSVLENPTNPGFFSEPTYAIREDKSLTASTYFDMDIKVKILNLRQKTSLLIDLSDLPREFRQVRVFKVEDSYYSVGCMIKQQSKGCVTLRRFSVKDQVSSCLLTLVQRDKKYYRNNGYDYVWTRLMVVTKDGNDGYRWIAGKYSKGRTSLLSCQLEPGEYYVMMTGDWGPRVFEMTLNCQGDQPIQLVRQPITKHPNILKQVCMDLAQRFGRLHQINRNICSYQYLDTVNGFLIENINNQVQRPVFYHRQYILRGKNFELVNKQKYQVDGDQHILQIKIDPDSHHTFIVKMFNGVSRQLLDGFAF